MLTSIEKYHDRRFSGEIDGRRDMARERWQLTGAASESYEEFQVPNIAGPLARAFLAHLQIIPGQRILDVACGTGIIAREAAYLVGPKGSITGIDRNKDMLDVARQHAPTRSTQLEWHHGDAEQLPFPDSHFDVVLCQQGLQFFPDKLLALTEMHRVLEPGGWVGLCVWRGIEHSPLHHEVGKALRRYAGSQAAEQMEAPFAFGDADALFALMSEAGFTEIEIWAAVETVSIPPPETSVPALLASTPVGKVFAELGDRSRNGLIEDISVALEPYRTDDGIDVPQAAHIALAKKGQNLAGRD
jgi:ubiquinone/menaquinone biosynthesis C-methylase UbiE